MLIYSIHTQRDHTAKRLCLSNIGYLAKCSVAWSILIQVALEIHAPIHSLIARSWSGTLTTIFRRKKNQEIIKLLLCLSGGLMEKWHVQPPTIGAQFCNSSNLLKWQCRILLSWDSVSLQLLRGSSFFSDTRHCR